VFKDTPGRTIFRKPKSQLTFDKLGPGTYNIISDKTHTASHSFGYKFQNTQKYDSPPKELSDLSKEP